MKQKYQLDPSSKKFVCPVCEKRRFVRMIDELGNYISDEFGRCDRSSSCGYFKYPQSSDKTIKIDVALQRIPAPNMKVGPPSTIPNSYVERSLKGYASNPLYQHLSNTFNSEDVDEIFKMYKVGTSKKWGGSAVFWQININFEVHTGKVIKFDPLIGKRIKEPRALITWVHKLLELKGFNLKQVLFGEHLLSQHPQKTVCVVESEKTAIIMAIKHPKYLWLATGSKDELKVEKLKVLFGRKVVLFPDTDFHAYWTEKADFISKQLNINLVVSKYLMNCTIAIDQNKGYDLADFNQINIDLSTLMANEETSRNSNLELLIQRNPYLSELIRVFYLDVT